MQELISSMKQEISFFESSIDPITRLSTDMNITLSGWIAIEAGCYLATRVLSSDLEEGRSHCDIDVETQVSELKTLHVEECAPFICASFDIECVPEVSSSPNTPLHNTFEVKSCYLF
jgi:hypothetical protein